jgi:hypothetical protein
VASVIRGRGIAGGKGTGPILVSPDPISFLGGVDPKTGMVVEPGHPLQGKSVAGRVLYFPHGKGSTVGSYVLYALRHHGKAPAAIVNREAEPIIVVGAIIAGIPMMDRPEGAIEKIPDGTRVTVDGGKGELTCEGELEGH